jgi:hypothetical protein
MTREQFAGWLGAYGKAWEGRDPEAAAALFTADARYHWTPFGVPKRGRAEIAQAWREATSRQSDVRFAYEILGVGEERGIAHWRTTLARASTGAAVTIDGVLTAELGADGLCSLFREWWHAEEKPQDP